MRTHRTSDRTSDRTPGTAANRGHAPRRSYAALPLAAGVCAAALLLRPAPAPAQEGAGAARLVTLGLIGGLARAPQLDAFSVEGPTALGFNAGLSAEARTPLRPLRFRADASYADWGGDRFGALTANAVLVAPVRWPAVPYLLGGAGGYRGREGRITAGYTVGAGLRLPAGPRTVVVESRIHVFGNGRYGRSQALGTLQPGAVRTRGVWLPLSLGVQF